MANLRPLLSGLTLSDSTRTARSSEITRHSITTTLIPPEFLLRAFWETTTPRGTIRIKWPTQSSRVNSMTSYIQQTSVTTTNLQEPKLIGSLINVIAAAFLLLEIYDAICWLYCVHAFTDIACCRVLAKVFTVIFQRDLMVCVVVLRPLNRLHWADTARYQIRFFNFWSRPQAWTLGLNSLAKV